MNEEGVNQTYVYDGTTVGHTYDAPHLSTGMSQRRQHIVSDPKRLAHKLDPANLDGTDGTGALARSAAVASFVFFP